LWKGEGEEKEGRLGVDAIVAIFSYRILHRPILPSSPTLKIERHC
jgi:hypothetical protein